MTAEINGSTTPQGQLRRGSQKASAVIWPWREDEKNRHSEVLKLRRSGVIRGVIGSAIGGVLFFFGLNHLATVAWVLSGLVLFLSVIAPIKGYKKLDWLMIKSGEIVGTILTWLLLSPVFYLFFMPFGKIFRRGSRDTLARQLDNEKKSYWKPAKEGDKTLQKSERPY